MGKTKRKKGGSNNWEFVNNNWEFVNNSNNTNGEIVRNNDNGESIPLKLIGVGLIRGYKIKGKNIILLGDTHADINLDRINKEREILVIDLFKKNVKENNKKCFDLFLEQHTTHLNNSRTIPREILRTSKIKRDRVDEMNISLLYMGGADQEKGVINDNERINTLALFRNDRDIITCSTHYINKRSVSHRTERSKCVFENLRVHNLDIRIPLLIPSYIEKTRMDIDKYSNDIFIPYFNVMIQSTCENDLLLFLESEFKGCDKEPYIELWRLLRKEESKISLSCEELIFLKENLVNISLNLEDYSNHVRQLDIVEEGMICKFFNAKRTFLSFLLDYYSMLRMFIDYEFEEEREDYIEEDNLRNVSKAVYHSKNIWEMNDKRKGERGPSECRYKNNENIVYYIGGAHLITISILLENMGAELYLSGIKNKSYIDYDLRLDEILKKSGESFVHIEDFDEIFSG